MNVRIRRQLAKYRHPIAWLAPYGYWIAHKLRVPVSHAEIDIIDSYKAAHEVRRL